MKYTFQIIFLFFCIQLDAQYEDLQKMMDSLAQSAQDLEKAFKEKGNELGKLQLTIPNNQNTGKEKLSSEASLEKLPLKNAALLSKVKLFSNSDLTVFYKKSASAYKEAVLTDSETDEEDLDSLLASCSPNLLNELAFWAFLQNNYDLSIFYYLRILEKNPSNVRAASNLGAVCNVAGMPEVAASILESNLKNEPNNPSLLNNCGQAYLSMGEIEKAKSYLLHALGSAPWHPEANASLSWIFANQADKEKAKKYAAASLKSAYNPTAISVLQYIITDYDEFYEFLPAPSDELYPRTADRIAVPELAFPDNCTQVSDYSENVKNARSSLEEVLTRFTRTLENNIGGGDIGSFLGKMQNYTPSSDDKSARVLKGQLLIKKAEYRFMKKINQIQQDFSDFNERESKIISEKETERRKACDGDPECICKARYDLNNEYLRKLKGKYQSYKNAYWAATSEYARVLEYWEPIVSGENPVFNGELKGFSRKMLLLSTAINLCGLDLSSFGCCDVSDFQQDAGSEVDFSNECSGSLTIPFKNGEISMTCDKIKFKAGQILVMGFEHDFRNAQSTYMAGPGFGLRDGLVNLDASALIYVTVDQNGNMADLGLKSSLEATAFKVGELSQFGAEAELSVGIESGASYEVTGKMLSQSAAKWKGSF